MSRVLGLIEGRGPEIAIESGVNVRIESNRGGKFPYLTFRAVGLIEPDNPFLCSVCSDPATMIVPVSGEDEPPCDEHEDELAGTAA
jgi:hypothetical protein